MINRDDITNGAMGLPVPERMRLIQELLRSLEASQIDPVWEVEMRAELEARIADYESGKIPAREDWREAMAQLRQSLQSVKPS
jgi:putative addiction module component (TIGR02574 family)